MRTLGLAVVGLVAGLVVGLLLTDVGARIAMSDGGDPGDNLPLAMLLGLAPIMLAILGAVAAPLVSASRLAPCERLGDAAGSRSRAATARRRPSSPAGSLNPR